MTTIATVLFVWFALSGLFLIGWKRWGDRMARMDADMAQAVEAMRAAKE